MYRERRGIRYTFGGTVLDQAFSRSLLNQSMSKKQTPGLSRVNFSSECVQRKAGGGGFSEVDVVDWCVPARRTGRLWGERLNRDVVGVEGSCEGGRKAEGCTISGRLQRKHEGTPNSFTV
jgi:hypothetical protein